MKATLVLVGVLTMMGSTSCGGENRPAPRSDGCVLNVDFENYVDGLIGILNAGVRQLGDPFTDVKQKKVEVVNNKSLAFEGNRCAYVWTDKIEQQGRIILQRRFDAPEVPNEVMEFVYRPVSDKAVDLADFKVWYTMGYQSGAVGLALYARGSAQSGTYDLYDQAGQRVLANLRQSEWVRVVLARNQTEKMVDLWLGAPGQEKWIGRYPDMDPKRRVGRVEIGDDSQQKARGSGYWDNIRIGKPLAPGAPVSPSEVTRNVGDEIPTTQYPITVAQERQLFVDDAVVETMSGLNRVFHAPAKRPENPLLIPETPWETGSQCLVPYDVIRERPGEKLRLWYGCYWKGKRVHTCLVESQDGLRWSRPSLGLFEFGGSKENNIVWQGRGIRPNFDPRDPDPARRYKGMTRVAGFTPLFSPDGVRWTLAPAPAINQAYDASRFNWDPVGGKWLGSCKIFWNGKRARGYAESSDYVHWTDTSPMLTTDERDEPADQLYCLHIVRYESIYLGLLKVYRTRTDQCHIQLAFSRNARRWERPCREPFLPNADQKGAYDHGNIDEAGEPIRMGDDLRFYYGGRHHLHNEKRPGETTGSLCAATLRVDGFASFDGGEKEGVLLTKPLRLKGKSLFINADAQAGEVRVEVLDEKSATLAPFTRANCRPLTSDTVRQEVAWKDSPGLESLQDKVIRLRFHLRNAKIYSFWME